MKDLQTLLEYFRELADDETPSLSLRKNELVFEMLEQCGAVDKVRAALMILSKPTLDQLKELMTSTRGIGRQRQNAEAMAQALEMVVPTID